MAWSVFALVFCLGAGPALAQGLFDKTADWGTAEFPPQRGSVKVPGSVTFANGTYTLRGNGDDIWDNNDEGFFVYTEKAGSWRLSGRVQWNDPGSNEWSKVGLMIRENGAGPASRAFYTILRGNDFGDQTDAAWRETTGGSSFNAQSFQPDPDNPGSTIPVQATMDGLWLSVTRIAEADMVIAEYSFDGVTWVTAYTMVMAFPETVAYGLCITNHDDNDYLVEAAVSDVKLEEAVATLAVRTLAGPTYFGSNSFFQAGDEFAVTLDVTNTSGASIPSVLKETVPAGWIVSDISGGGTEAAGVITWNQPVPDGKSSVGYKVTVPADPNPNAVFIGDVNGAGTAGPSVVNRLGGAVGIFDAHADIGAVGAAGAAAYNEALGEYEVTGSGSDIWDSADEFHFVFKEVNGAFSLKALVELDPFESGNDWTKAGLMAREELTADSVNYSTIIRRDLQQDAQWRLVKGGPSAGTDANMNNDQMGELEITRTGDIFQTWYISLETGQRTLLNTQVMEMRDPIYVGLCVASHEDGKLTKGYFLDTEMETYPAFVVRTLPVDAMPQGGGVVEGVKLTVEAAPGAPFSGTVVENLPTGLTASNFSNGDAAFANGKITWTINALEGAAELTYDLTVSESAAKNVATLSGQVNFSGGKSLATVGDDSLYPVFWNVPYFDRAATLDGVISEGEYEGAYSETFAHEDGDLTPPGVHWSGKAYPADEENATFHIFHNSQYIFVAVDVVDPVLDFESGFIAFTEAWRNDSVELHMDGNLSRLADKEDNRFGFQAAVLGDGSQTASTSAPTPVALTGGGYASTNGAFWNYGARVKDDGTGYIVEYQIDKSQILDPPTRTVIGFDILMNGAEGTGDRTSKWGYWNTKLGMAQSDAEHWGDERGWAIIELVGAPVQSVSEWSLF